MVEKDNFSLNEIPLGTDNLIETAGELAESIPSQPVENPGDLFEVKRFES